MKELVVPANIETGGIGSLNVFKGTENDLIDRLNFRIAHRYYACNKTHRILIASTSNPNLWLYRMFSQEKGTIYTEIVEIFKQAGFEYKLIEIYKEDPKRPSYLRVVK